MRGGEYKEDMHKIKKEDEGEEKVKENIQRSKDNFCCSLRPSLYK
jgi:hypothetical protein